MKRLPGEDFGEYQRRRSGENLVTKAHLNGRLPSGEYFDRALHKTMEKTGRSERNKRWFANGVLLILSGLAGYGVGTILYWII